MAKVPIADGLFTWPAEQPELIGSCCDECGTVVFPSQPGCPGCAGTNTVDAPLPRTGTLYTWTTQQFPPVAPPYLGPTDRESFASFGIGWVDLDGKVMVEARLTESDPKKLSFGMPVELVVVPFTTDAEGNEVMTFAFAPTA
jgi:uncharacterized OB-fold protein